MNKYLQKRGAVWQFRMRVPEDVAEQFGRDVIKESTKERDIIYARRYRDRRLKELQSQWRAIREGGLDLGLSLSPLVQEALKYRREEQMSDGAGSADVTYREILIDHLDERLGRFFASLRKSDPQLASELSKEDAYTMLGEEDPRAAEIMNAIDVASGQTPIVIAGEQMLARARNNKGELFAETTKAECRRIFARAEEHFGTLDRVTAIRARKYIQDLAASGLSEKSVRNHQSFLSRLWSSEGLDGSIWSRGFKIEYAASGNPPRKPWTEQEIRQHYEECGKDWLLDVMVLAAHTGMRRKELAGFDFNAATGLVSISREATKTESGVRQFVLPSALRHVAARWKAKPRSYSSIGNEFRKLSKALGYGDHVGKVFHSFRNYVIQCLTDQQVSEAHLAWTLGHVIDETKAPSAKMYATPGDPHTYAYVLESLPLVLPEGWEINPSEEVSR
ncbi:MAG: DUF6538 domain-containing protein [Pseudomonadota bacterium]